MKKVALGRWTGVAVLGIAAAEVIIMSSPFAGFFYASLGMQPLQGVLSERASTAWLTSFFLNSTAATDSWLLEFHHEAGRFLLAAGIWGFLISAAQVYGNKLFRRGVAKGLLYRVVRHPQYVCLAVAGYGMLVLWPRILLLGLWVTMLFLYAGLARFEEARMTEKYGDGYTEWAEARGAFVPGSPVRRAFEASFGRLRPRALSWVVAYVVCLGGAFTLALGLRGLVVQRVSHVSTPDDQGVIVGLWPMDDDWLRSVYEIATSDSRVSREVRDRRGDKPILVTVMPTDYRRRATYYSTPGPGQTRPTVGLEDITWKSVWSLLELYLIPRRGFRWGDRPLNGTKLGTRGVVRVVFSSAERAYGPELEPDEVLGLGVRTRPLMVADVAQLRRRVVKRIQPRPQNRWGPRVVTPVF